MEDAFTVLTFDMPGMSRSAAPTSAYKDVTAALLADQVVGLLDKLSIPRAFFYGSSSGGATVLALIARHPARVIRGIVHEVPLSPKDDIKGKQLLLDSEIEDGCRIIFDTVLNEDKAAWERLGSNYHARLHEYYVTWTRYYVTDHFAAYMQSLTDEELKRRPITWTIGALMPAGLSDENVRLPLV